MKWYKHSPDKWLAGTRGMSFEQKGLHADLISVYVDRNGNLSDDDELLPRILSCRPQNYRRLKAELLKIDKLHIVDAKLVPNGAETSLKLGRKSQFRGSLQGKKPKKSTKNTPQILDYRSKPARAGSTRARAGDKNSRQKKWEEVCDKVEAAHFAEIGRQPSSEDVPGYHNGRPGNVHDRDD